jgi:hypothetical protein
MHIYDTRKIFDNRQKIVRIFFYQQGGPLHFGKKNLELTLKKIFSFFKDHKCIYMIQEKFLITAEKYVRIVSNIYLFSVF